MSSNIHKSAKGVMVDMARLKLLNETSIAVGNAGTNARGDIVKGGKIIKTREEIARENYKLQSNNIRRSNAIPSESLAHADTPTSAEVDIDEENFINPPAAPVGVPTTPPISRGGLAEAIRRSKEEASLKK